MEVLDGPFKLFLSTFTENITHTRKNELLLYIFIKKYFCNNLLVKAETFLIILEKVTVLLS